MAIQSLGSDLRYARKMAAAGWTGIASARQEHNRNLLTPAGSAVWIPAALGAGIGILSGLGARRRSASWVALGGFVGSILGFGAGVAWQSRHFTGSAARNAARHIGAVLDERWLERNPINYA